MGHRVTATGEQTTLADRKRRAGQRLLLGMTGPSICGDLRALLRIFAPAAFLLGPDNAEEPEQLRELNRELGSLAPRRLPSLSFVEQDGGRALCPGAMAWPALALLEGADPALSAEVGAALSEEAAALGFHALLAPSLCVSLLDAEPLPASRPLAPRLLAREPAALAQRAEAFLGAVAQRGLLGCPGAFQGWTQGEDGRPLALEKERPALEAEDLLPLRAALRSGILALRVGYARWPAHDEERPAVCSPPLLAGLLREDLDFEGLIVTEDLALPALREQAHLEDHLQAACGASADLLIASHDPTFQVRIFETLVRLQELDSSVDQALESCDKRLKRVRRALFPRWRPGSLAALNGPEQGDLALRMRLATA